MAMEEEINWIEKMVNAEHIGKKMKEINEKQNLGFEVKVGDGFYLSKELDKYITLSISCSFQNGVDFCGIISATLPKPGYFMPEKIITSINKFIKYRDNLKQEGYVIYGVEIDRDTIDFIYNININSDNRLEKLMKDFS